MNAAADPGLADPRSDWADQAEQRLLDAALPRAAALGWTDQLVWAAAKDCGLSRGDAELLAPHGPADLAALLSRRHDAAAMASLTDIDASGLKIRERIARGVKARLDAAAADAA